MSHQNEDNPEESLICRCSDCETSKWHKCNSSLLKDLLSNLFDDVSLDNLPGLYCRKKIQGSALEAIVEGCECLCGECGLTEINRKYYCKYIGIPTENSENVSTTRTTEDIT